MSKMYVLYVKQQLYLDRADQTHWIENGAKLAI